MLRHDLDIDIFNCEKISDIEVDLGLRATYFFQPNNDYYNPLSSQCSKILEKLSLNHDLGLHIAPYLFSDSGEMEEQINKLFNFYESHFPIKKVFSFHRPAKYLKNPGIKINGFINAYDSCFIEKMQYVSDSNRRPFMDQDRLWDAFNKNQSMHLLTHPIWWHDTSLEVKQILDYLHIQTNSMICDYALSNNATLFHEHFLRLKED